MIQEVATNVDLISNSDGDAGVSTIALTIYRIVELKSRLSKISIGKKNQKNPNTFSREETMSYQILVAVSQLFSLIKKYINFHFHLFRSVYSGSVQPCGESSGWRCVVLFVPTIVQEQSKSSVLGWMADAWGSWACLHIRQVYFLESSTLYFRYVI